MPKENFFRFILEQSKVLVVAAHPDDEMLGCGGTLARLRKNGATISILLLGEGPTARLTESGELESNAKKQATNSATEAARLLDIPDPIFLNLPDNKFDTLPLLEITQAVEKVLFSFKPDVIFTHHGGDLNKDHRLTHQAVLTACRPLPEANPMSILGFEVLSSTEYAVSNAFASFLPNCYVDISATLADKQKALTAYASEMRPWPHPRSHEGVEYLAKLRGSQCGKDAAEAFTLYRYVL